MTKETAHIEETEPEDVAETAPSGEKNAEDKRKEKLEVLYKRLPKIISQIRIENNEGVRQNALDSLLNYFEQINGLEQSLLPAGETFHPLTLSRVYELAVSGGGADGEKAKQFEEANKAFAEENEILAKTVESLSFQIERMKGQAADELIGAGKMSRLPLDDLKSALADVAGTVDRIEKSFAALRPEEGTPAKSLDEEFLKALRDSDDLTPELLKSADGKVTYLGKLIRKAGFAYDYRDAAAVRALIGASLGANRKLAETIEILAPAKEQVGKIQKIIALIDVAAGHEERQGPQYREAIEEIERLQLILSVYREKNGELEELDAAIRKRSEESSELVQTMN